MARSVNDLEDGAGPVVEKSIPPAERVEDLPIEAGPILIFAGAGSGKTRALTIRIAKLIGGGVEPWRILALTFTNKAANELRERVDKLAPSQGAQVLTFHSLALRLLRRHADRLGYPTDFTLYDRLDSERALKRIIADMPGTLAEIAPRRAGSFISRKKGAMIAPTDAAEAEYKLNRHLWEIYRAYESSLMRAKAVDFDDLLLLTFQLLKKNEDIRALYRERYEHILIDEFQDTNRLQYEIIKLILNESANICVVGDDDQSIYQWRGATIRNILDFEKDFPTSTVLKLERNYRSSGNIIAAASTLIARLTDRRAKNIWTANDPGEKVTLAELGTPYDEANWIIRKIAELSGRSDFDPASVAIFYRANWQSRAIEEIARENGYGVEVFGSQKFYERREIKDILSYLILALNRADDVAFRRAIGSVRRGLGQVALGKLEARARSESTSLMETIGKIDQCDEFKDIERARFTEFARLIDELTAVATNEGLSASRAIERVGALSGYFDRLKSDTSPEGLARLENIDELIRSASDRSDRGADSTIRAFLDRLALLDEADSADASSARLKLMTAHVSKGLEFDTVFLIGLEEELFPHARSLDDNRALDEERRLMYVAMTRARKRLFLTRAKERSRFGSPPILTLRSRFLDDIDPRVLKIDHGALYRARSPLGQARRSGEGGAPESFSAPPRPSRPIGAIARAKNSAGADRARRYRVGDLVESPRYKEGKVIDISGSGAREKLTVLFPLHGEKLLFARLANLKIKR